MTEPHYAKINAHNVAKGEETRRKVLAAWQFLGPDATRVAVAKLAGYSLLTTGRAMQKIRDGWKPQ